ncbi:uncharacterized protein TNCV_2746251 [Trichonephila clavipes]|nr:uncharacterized protein TNCV_2746251 [Trichonephila clavipes]
MSSSQVPLKSHQAEGANALKICRGSKVSTLVWGLEVRRGDVSSETNGAGPGWFCRLFEDSLAVGKNAATYDDEVLAECDATTQLLHACLAAAKVVFCIDSEATISALSSNTPTVTA